MDTQTTVVIFAILAAFGLLAVVAVDIVLDTQEAEAQSICSQIQGGFKNATNRFLCPPN